MKMVEYSFSPNGEGFPLPSREDYTKESERLRELVRYHRSLGREIVVVMGLGFVGAVMAAVIADAVDENGSPTKFVMGMQRPSTRSFWKIPFLNRGTAPVSSEDPLVDTMIDNCVNKKKTLAATFIYDALKFAEVVVVDIQCDYVKESIGNVRDGRADMEALEESLEIIGQHISPKTLVLIETTVAQVQQNRWLIQS
jgi:UDP-glucose 6-dehydrogenase